MKFFKQYKFIFYQLFRPFSYLTIKHDEKWFYDWLLPLVLTIFCAIVIYLFIPMSSVVGNEGLISSITSFIANLPGFFIAALAAVATFNKEGMDRIMSNPPTMIVLFDGNPTRIELTRRRFLTVLFAYLTMMSILLVVVTKFALFIDISKDYRLFFEWVGICLFFYFLWQMIVSTILGLYYLGERLHME